MCVQYFSGMAWISLYYRKGMRGVNTNWSYPFFYAPMLQDLAITIRDLAKNDLQLEEVKMSSKILKYNIVHQMLCILPPASKTLLPPAAQVFYLDQSPIIDQFPENFMLDRDGKMKDYQAHALVPHADIQRIVVATKNIPLKRKTLKELSEEQSKVWVQKRRTQDDVIYNRPLTTDILTAPSLTGGVERSDRALPIDPMTEIPLQERLQKADLPYVSFNPKDRVFHVFPSTQEVPRKPPKIEIFRAFDLDYSELPVVVRT
jgi:hypothetical protein